jgi:DNA-binding response OmpR family regulator
MSHIKKILLAEDDRRIATALTIRLQDAGYQVIAVHDGLRGYTWSLSEKPDLILMDIMMPKASGLEVATELRRAGVGAVPIIFITASLRPDLRAAAGELGAVGYFEKPFDMAELLRTISRVLQNTKLIPSLRLALEPLRDDAPAAFGASGT